MIIGKRFLAKESLILQQFALDARKRQLPNHSGFTTLYGVYFLGDGHRWIEFQLAFFAFTGNRRERHFPLTDLIVRHIDSAILQFSICLVSTSARNRI